MAAEGNFRLLSVTTQDDQKYATLSSGGHYQTSAVGSQLEKIVKSWQLMMKGIEQR